MPAKLLNFESLHPTEQRRNAYAAVMDVIQNIFFEEFYIFHRSAVKILK